MVADAGRPDALLVLDDYHLVSSDTVHASVRFLLEHRPPQLRIVLAGRSDPPLGLARYRARGELGEVRADDLRFTAGEAAELLGQVSADVDAPLAAALAERTEGWAAGLQLAALSLRSQPDIARFVAAFTGSHRYVLDYLTEEVLEQQRPELRGFLLETSVLERLSGSLCDAVTGRDDSQDLLEEADRSGLFVIQLDDVRGWWRYHHLFADLLRARLDPQRGRRLHRNAAAWYSQRGLPDDAVRHALAAGEPEWAARLVEEHFDSVFNLRGEQATIQSWLPALPPDVVRSRPRLLLAQAQMASMRGDLQTMEPLLAAAEQVIGRTDHERFEPSTGPAGSLLVNVRAMLALQRSYAAQLRGDAEATAALTREAMTHLGQDELMLTSAVQGFLAMAEWLRGRLAAAQQGFESSIGWWRQQGQVTTTAWGYYCLARLQRGQGRLDAAARTCEQALDAADQPGRPAGPGPPARASGRQPGPGQPGRACGRPPGPRSSAWPRWRTSATTSAGRWITSSGGRRCAVSSSTPRRWRPGWPSWPGSARRPATGTGRRRPSRRRSRSPRAPPGCSTRSRRSGPGCCWPRETWPRWPGGALMRVCGPTARLTIRASQATWSWPGCCSPRMMPDRRWSCSTGWKPPPRPSAATAV